MERNLQISILLDFYGQLLSENQRTAVTLYYNNDLSLSEIGEEMQITRQGARDLIKRGELALYQLEEKLDLSGRFSEIGAELEAIKESANLIISESAGQTANLQTIIRLAEKILDTADNMKY